MSALLAGLAFTAAAPAAGVEVAPGWIHRHWGPEHGLPVVGVNALAQDERGYLWLATFDGLARFDGVRFETMAASNDDEMPPSERFTTLWQGRTGDLWLSSETHALVRFDPLRNRFAPTGVEERGELRAIGRDPVGQLVLGTGAELLVEGQHGAPAVVASTGAARIRSVAFAASGEILLGTTGAGALRAAPGRPLRPLEGLPDGLTVTALLADGDDLLWVGTEEGLWRLTGTLAEPVELAEGSGPVLRLEPRSSGGVWAAVGARLHHVEGLTSRWASEESSRTGSEPIERRLGETVWLNTGRRLLRDGEEVIRVEGLIKDFLIDHEGSLWVATPDEGLHHLRPSPFTVIGAGEGLPPYPVYPIVEGLDGEVWLGLHGGGLARVRDSEVEPFLDERLPHVLTVLPLAAGEALVGAKGLWGFRQGRFRVEDAPPRLSNTIVLALFRDSKERLWVGTHFDGIYRRDPQGEWQHLPTVPAGSSPEAVRVFHESAGGTIWIGTNGGGLLRWRDGRLERLSRAEGFPSDLVRALWEDGAGGVWVGTENQGLVRVQVPAGASLTTAEISRVGPDHGLCHRGIHQILPDHLGNLWMSSNRGIFRVRLAELSAVADGRRPTLSCVNFTDAHGLPSREANGGVQSAGMRAGDGRLWFPTVAGVVIIDPDDVAKNRVPPPVTIEGVLPAGSTELLRLMPGDEALHLGRRQRTVEIWYSALSFIDPEWIRFRYRLEGLAEDWIDARDRRQVLFTNLRPGVFRFQVVAANEHGFWNDEGAAIALVVAPHWWETRWARGGALAVLLATTLGGLAVRGTHQRHRRRRLEMMVETRTSELADALQQVQLQAEELRDLDAAKSRFFAHLSHELRTPLTLLLGPLLEADQAPERLRSELPLMQRSARTLQRMVDQILDLEKAEAGHLELRRQPLDLRALAERVVKAFAGLAQSWNVALTVEDAQLSAVVVEADAERLEQVLANLVSNALKFTPAGGSVAVRVAESGEWGVVEVSDTGRGIPADALTRVFDRFFQVEGPGKSRGTGLGLAFAREVVELHGGRIEVASTPRRGATFRVTLPRCEARAEAPQEPAAATALTPPAMPPAPAPTPSPQRSPAAAAASWAEDDGRPAVLVVEDNRDIRRYLQRLLEPTYRTLVASDGVLGLELARRCLPDIVVADVGMPEMDGLEMCRRLRADPETEPIPLLFLTARVTRAQEMEGFAAGAVAYVRKPFDAATFMAQAASLLEQQMRLRRRLQALAAAARSPESRDGPVGSATSRSALATDREGLQEKARRVIADHLHDEAFGPEALARGLALGRSELFRRFREELGTTPAELIRAVRLERARELLAQGAGSVSEVGYAVGFDSLSSFSRAFRARYGEPPSATRRRRSA